MSDQVSATYPAAAIIYARSGRQRKPQAAWFRADDLVDVKSAATKRGLQFLAVTTARLRALAASIAQGSLTDTGSVSLEPTTAELFDEIEFLAANGPFEDPPEPEPEASVAEDFFETVPAADTQAGDDANVEGDARNSDELADRPRARRLRKEIWDHLSVGDLVLVPELDRHGTPEYWYEAIIVERSGDQFVLRWRDFPQDGPARRSRHHLALLHPVI